MMIIPAIDLRAGNVVRLTKGAFDQETRYSDAPAQITARWQEQGAQMIHVVDLDGARYGAPKNLTALKSILSAATIPIEFGGGLRTVDAVTSVLGSGVSRAVIGTKALDQNLLKALIRKFKEKIIVGLDVRDGVIQIRGWVAGESSRPLESIIQALEKVGVKTIIVTDVSRDGTLTGPNFKLLENVLSITKMDVIFSGGVSKIEDLEKLSTIKQPHFIGIIVGKALYEDKFKLSDAVKRFQGGPK